MSPNRIPFEKGRVEHALSDMQDHDQRAIFSLDKASVAMPFRQREKRTFAICWRCCLRSCLTCWYCGTQHGGT